MPTSPRTVRAEGTTIPVSFDGRADSDLVTAPDGDGAYFSEPGSQRVRRVDFASMTAEPKRIVISGAGERLLVAGGKSFEDLIYGFAYP